LLDNFVARKRPIKIVCECGTNNSDEPVVAIFKQFFERAVNFFGGWHIRTVHCGFQFGNLPGSVTARAFLHAQHRSKFPV
jgi:hypothetical protein